MTSSTDMKEVVREETRERKNLPVNQKPGGEADQSQACRSKVLWGFFLAIYQPEIDAPFLVALPLITLSFIKAENDFLRIVLVIILIFRHYSLSPGKSPPDTTL